MNTAQPSRKPPWRVVVEWGIVPLVIGLIAAFVVVYLNDDAHGATPTTAAARSTAGVKSDPRRACVPPDPSMSCTAWAHNWADAKVDAFNAGNLGNAQGFTLPAKWRQAFNSYFARHPKAQARLEQRRGGDWWKWPLEAAACTPIAGMSYRVNCENASEHYTQYTEKVLKVIIVCGGLAAIGVLAGGGAAGAGKGALACMWGNIAIRVYNLAISWRVPTLRAIGKANTVIAGVKPLF